MRLSYITTCVNYLDRLRIAQYHNEGQFDDMLVVTHPTDHETLVWTQSRPDIIPIVTDAFYREGAVFNKGAALNEGLNALRQICTPEWVAIMDADTFLPPDGRAQLNELAAAGKLDPEWFYGVERVLLPTWGDYERLWRDDIGSFESPRGFAFGWFQLFHWGSSAIQSKPVGEWYPTGPDCTEVDWRFFRTWGNLEPGYEAATGRIAKLPFKAFNLGLHGVDHQGRRSAPFAPPS